VTEENNVINIAGTDYNPEDLTDQQKYWIAQINDLQQKRQNSQFQLDQINVSLDGFTNALVESLTIVNEEIKEKLNG
jgi:hypothetical protein|tara:strand:+ start:706 stop:936 length:231 start_codon:yes stop_codon:yes gene_type:complete